MNQQMTLSGMAAGPVRVARRKILAARFTDAEAAWLAQRALAAGQPLAEWMREQLLATATHEPEDPLFTELIAFRILVNEALAALVSDFGLTPQHLRGIQERTRLSKHRKARQVLAQYKNSEAAYDRQF